MNTSPGPVQNGWFNISAPLESTMKTRAIAASAIVVLLVAGVATVALANSGVAVPGIGLGAGAQGANHQDNQGQRGQQANTAHNDNESEDGAEHEGGGQFNFTVGQTFTLANLTGHFNNLTNQTEETEHDDSRAGNASGTFTFKVTAVSAHQVNLSIVSGDFVLNNTKYTVTGGSITLNGEGRAGSGMGTASNGVTFAIRLDGIHGNLTSADVGAIKLDVKAGTSEYHVLLGSHASEGTEESDTSED